MNNKGVKYALIFTAIMAISTMLVGMSLFDKNGKLDKVVYIASIAGFVIIATIIATITALMLLGALIEVVSEKQSRKLKQIINIKLTELNIYSELEDWDCARSILEELIYITSKSQARDPVRIKLKLLDKILSNLQEQDYRLSVAAESSCKDIECILSMVEKTINTIPKSEQAIHPSLKNLKFTLQKLHCTYSKLQWPILSNTNNLLYAVLLFETLDTILKSQNVHTELQELSNACCVLEEKNWLLIKKSSCRSSDSEISSIMSYMIMEEGLEVKNIYK